MSYIERWRAQASANSEFLMVLALFVAYRVMMLMLFLPTSFLTGNYTDFLYYFDFASVSKANHYPWVDIWFEYPPVFPYYAIAVFQLTRPLSENFNYFARTLSLAMLPFETLVLVNVYRIARVAYGAVVATRAAWVYSLLILPVFFWQFSFDSLVVALTLQSLYWLMTRRRDASALALALAIGTKFAPAYLIGVAWRFAPNTRAVVRYTLLVAAGSALIFLPFFVISPQFFLASLQSLSVRSSWETIWALFDGNESFGYVGTLAEQFDPAVANIPMGHPSVIPMWIALIPFALIFLYFYTRPMVRDNPRHILIFTGITIMLYHLWSKGWSPQWATLILPLLLLLFPGWRGVLFVLVFSFATLLDWPLSFALDSRPLAVTAILIRTGLFILIGIELFMELSRDNATARTVT